jgi:EAL domain-containing protein (putative c-di-GMP-specific phosphodiesterase class I)
VETAEHLGFLQQEGCDEAQGYFLGRPAPLGEIRHLVSATTMPVAADSLKRRELLAG